MFYQVPHLVTYFMVSIFPQFPVVIYLGFLQEIVFPIDLIATILMLFFLVWAISYNYLCISFVYLNEMKLVTLADWPLRTHTNSATLCLRRLYCNMCRHVSISQQCVMLTQHTISTSTAFMNFSVKCLSLQVLNLMTAFFTIRRLLRLQTSQFMRLSGEQSKLIQLKVASAQQCR